MRRIHVWPESISHVQTPSGNALEQGYHLPGLTCPVPGPGRRPAIISQLQCHQRGYKGLYLVALQSVCPRKLGACLDQRSTLASCCDICEHDPDRISFMNVFVKY